MTESLRWRIYCPKGELVAVTRYARTAAKVAIAEGAGATVRHRGRVILTVTDDAALEGALPIADEMIALAYRPPLQRPAA